MESEIKDPYILLTDKKISSQQDIVSILEPLLKVTKDIVLIADEIEGEALATLIVNKMRGSLNVLAIKAPGFGDRRKEMLEDIAVLTGGQVIVNETGASFENLDVSMLGRAKTVWADKDNSRIIEGTGDKSKIKSRIESIKKQISNVTSEFDKEKFEERLAKLTNGVAVISVGANTEVELGEKKERIIDAIAATKAALEDGIIPGGTITLIHASEKLGKTDGESILKNALRQPLYVLLENSGLMYLEWYPKICADKKGYGVDATDGVFKNMIDAGIIEPTKVVVSAIENAVSVASTIITTKVLITDKKEELQEKAQ
jgi:chaperonin GroEL